MIIENLILYSPNVFFFVIFLNNLIKVINKFNHWIMKIIVNSQTNWKITD